MKTPKMVRLPNIINTLREAGLTVIHMRHQSDCFYRRPCIGRCREFESLDSIVERFLGAVIAVHTAFQGSDGKIYLFCVEISNDTISELLDEIDQISRSSTPSNCRSPWVRFVPMVPYTRYGAIRLWTTSMGTRESKDLDLETSLRDTQERLEERVRAAVEEILRRIGTFCTPTPAPKDYKRKLRLNR